MLLTLLLPSLALADWPPGALIDPAVSVDLTESGLNAAVDTVPGMLPAQMDLPDMYGEGTLYRYWVRNMWVAFEVTGSDVQTDLDTIHLNIDLSAWMNNAEDPFNVEADAYTFWWWNLADCAVHVDPFPVGIVADLDLRMDYTQVPARLDAEIVLLEDVSVGLDREAVTMECWVGSADEILDYVGLSPVDMAIDFALEEINGQVEGMLDELEVTIEDSFNGLAIEQTVDLGGIPLEVSLHPTDVKVRPEGLRVVMGGSFDAPAHECVAAYEVNKSPATQGLAPDIGSAPGDLALTPHHVGAFIDDDWLNQALYAVWRAGILCQDLSADDGLPLTTALLASFSPDYATFFPDSSAALQLITRPAAPPILLAEGGRDLNLRVEKLGVDIMADLDYRRMRVMGAELTVEGGADLALEPATGMLAVLLDLDADGLQTEILHNELIPDQNSALEAGFANLYEGVILPLILSYTGDLNFQIPSFSGFGLLSLDVRPAGSESDHFGAYANIGPVSYGEGTGCNSSEGGCSGGCATGAPWGGMFGFSLGLGALLRRRRSA